MKAIMISIQPQHVANILNGNKTLEIRKTLPKCDFPIDVYIYCTKDKKYANLINRGGFLTGMVVAKFTLNKVEEIVCRTICGDWESYTKTLGYSEIENASCLKNIDIVHYLKGKTGYAWHIDNLVPFDKPKEIKEFRKYCDKHFSWWKNKCLDCKAYTPDTDIEDYCNKNKLALTKAPQSFCFIEV